MVKFNDIYYMSSFRPREAFDLLILVVKAGTECIIIVNNNIIIFVTHITTRDFFPFIIACLLVISWYFHYFKFNRIKT